MDKGMDFGEWQKEQQARQQQTGHQPGQQAGGTGSRTNGGQGRGQNRSYSNGYVGAPYNFVSFYNDVYKYSEKKNLTAHNEMKDELVTGEITYEVTAETPIMIDDGTQHFFKDAKGRYAIPGSTMRGLIRNNVQVLGLCSYDDDIDDYALMYRNVAGGAEKKQYDDTLDSKPIRINDGNKSYGLNVLLNVRAGYVINENGKYVIYQTAVDSIKKEFKQMNYYVLSERKIINDYLKYGENFSYRFFLQNGKSILQHEFQAFTQYKDRNGRKHYKGVTNSRYKHPYCLPISYQVAHEKDIIAVGNPRDDENPGDYENEGYAVSSGKMNEKKAVYIIPAIDKEKEAITIPDEDVKAFQIDLKKRENTLKNFGGKKYFDLPEEGEMKPVFYIQLDGKLYFGFTPRLRLFYAHRLKEGLKQKWSTGSVDYGRALFGYSTPGKSYKSKLSFSDAVLLEKIPSGAEQRLILAEPKPTSYLDYLKQNQDTPVTYNKDEFELRGAKQYWLHTSLVSAEGAVRNENVSSTMRPLKEGAKFTGKIRFRNLKEDELGLLLWSVRLEEDSQMNVGKAKAYGYGRISVKITKARKLDLQKAYRFDEELCLDPFGDIKINAAIDTYKKTINQYLIESAAQSSSTEQTKSIEELPHIQDFFAMKDARRIPENEKTRYMRIDAREYQNRSNALPTVRSIVKSE